MKGSTKKRTQPITYLFNRMEYLAAEHEMRTAEKEKTKSQHTIELIEQYTNNKSRIVDTGKLVELLERMEVAIPSRFSCLFPQPMQFKIWSEGIDYLVGYTSNSEAVGYRIMYDGSIHYAEFRGIPPILCTPGLKVDINECIDNTMPALIELLEAIFPFIDDFQYWVEKTVDTLSDPNNDA